MPSATPEFQRYLRQMIHPAIGQAGQRKLAAARVLIVGCGALGTHVADTLARAGVGFLRIVDRDFVDLHNLQRQVLFDEADLAAGLPKALAAAEKLQRINSTVTVEPVVDDANAGNIAALIDQIDLIIDGTDNFETRYLLNDAAVRAKLPWIYGGVLATAGMTMTILPGETACLRCLFPDPPPPGVAPTCETAGVIAPAVATIAALEATEAMKIIVGATDAINRELLACDVWRLTFDRLPAIRQTDCPTCGDGPHEYPFLELAGNTRSVALCGRNTVQITPPGTVSLALPDLAERLSTVGTVRQNAHLLRFQPTEQAQELVVFPNGRTLIHGTDDLAVARSLYARYIGL